jgi:hypothetical protein
VSERCDCHGQCGGDGRRRACADPDLSGRCRAESGMPFPRSEQLVVLSPIQVADHFWVHLCQCCCAAWQHKIVAARPRDLYSLFPEGPT